MDRGRKLKFLSPRWEPELHVGPKYGMSLMAVSEALERLVVL
jgi:hypothetical protein